MDPLPLAYTLKTIKCRKQKNVERKESRIMKLNRNHLKYHCFFVVVVLDYPWV